MTIFLKRRTRYENKRYFSVILLIPFVFTNFILSSQNIPDFMVNENVSPDGAEQTNPAIGGNGSGRFVVVWKDNRMGFGDDIFAQIFADQNTPVGINFRVNDVYDDYYHYYPDVAADAEGRFVVAWCDDRDGEEAIYFQRYAADGNPLGANTKVESLAGSVFQRTPSVAVDASGNFIISWMDKQSNNTNILARRFSHDGLPLGNILEVNTPEDNTYCYKPAVSAGESGNFAICW